MNYEQFLEQMKEDLKARFTTDLPPEYADVRIGIRYVEKLQGESYRGLSFRSGDSPVEANLNMTGAFQAYEAGRPYSKEFFYCPERIRRKASHAGKRRIIQAFGGGTIQADTRCQMQHNKVQPQRLKRRRPIMAFFNSAITVLQTLVIALGAGLGIWGAINLLEGYGNDNPGAKSQGMKQFMAN